VGEGSAVVRGRDCYTSAFSLSANAHPALEDTCGWLPLHYAVDRGHIECVKSLLAYPNYLGLTGLKPALDISRGNEFTEITAVLEQAYQK
jgi:ankyrin repeat protein